MSGGLNLVYSFYAVAFATIPSTKPLSSPPCRGEGTRPTALTVSDCGTDRWARKRRPTGMGLPLPRCYHLVSPLSASGENFRVNGGFGDVGGLRQIEPRVI
jgi:hypothetical protein